MGCTRPIRNGIQARGSSRTSGSPTSCGSRGRVLGVAAATLCAVLLLVPGLFFLAFSRRLASRDLALAHAASFAKGREAILIQDLADELRVPREAAMRVLQVAIQEGYLRGTFRG